MDNTPSNFTNTCFGGRLSYVDAQKGILILLVVFHHINNYARSLNIEIDEICDELEIKVPTFKELMEEK